MNKETLVGIPRGCEILNAAKPSRFYQWIHSKKMPFPFFKVGSYVRFRETDVFAYLESVKIDHTKGNSCCSASSR